MVRRDARNGGKDVSEGEKMEGLQKGKRGREMLAEHLKVDFYKIH